MIVFRLFGMFLLLWIACGGLPVHANSVEIDKLLDQAENNISINRGLASKLLTQAQSQITTAGNIGQRARLLNLKAHVDILSNNLESAFNSAKRAQLLGVEAGNKLEIAEALRKQGIIAFLLNIDAEAIALLTESLLMHTELGSRYIVNNLQSIGNVYAREDVWADDLIEIGEMLVVEAVKSQDLYYEEQGYAFIVSGLLAKGEYQQANQILKQAMKSQKYSGRFLEYYAAVTELRLGNYQQATHYADIHYQKALESNQILRVLAINLIKAELLHVLQQQDEAERLLESVVAESHKISYTKYELEALQKLAHYHSIDGDYEQAFVYSQRYSALRETVLEKRQSAQLAFNRARLESEQQNLQINELMLTQQLNEQQNRSQFYFIVTATSIALLLFILFIRSSQQKRQLRRYAASLSEATKAKSEFLARMSHEIRTPINAIIGLTKLTQKSALNTVQFTNLQQIEQSSFTLLGVINDILDFSKIEAHKLDIEEAPFELNKVVEQAIRLQSLIANEKRIELIQYVAKDVPLNLVGDSLRIQQVLNNLLSNAVKFTEQGLVSVSINRKYAESGVLLEFAIKDTGIGLSAEQIDKLFEAFSQADESTTRQYGGTGLGLSICKNLVELMGGRIWVESKPYQGATFYFTVQVEESLEIDNDAVNTDLSALRILVIDDTELSRQAIAEALQRFGIEAEMATGGVKGLEILRSAVDEKEPFDLVLLDWKMDDIDGIELTSIINQELDKDKPEVVLLSAYDMASLQDLGKPLGIRHFLQKPVNSSSLYDCLVDIGNGSSFEENSVKSVASKDVPDFTGIQILLVEDNALNRKVAKFFLEETNATITTAQNGRVAVALLTEESMYDLVLMDIQMPEMDGLTATKIIRKELANDIPIIAMTAHAMAGDVEKSLAAGMNAHVTKPIDPVYLYRIINQFLNKKTNQTRQGKTKASIENKIQIEGAESEQLIKIDRPAALKKIGFDEVLYRSLVRDFLDLHSELELLQSAIENENYEEIFRVTHIYCSALKYIGAYNLAKLADYLQEALYHQQQHSVGDFETKLSLFSQKLTELNEQLTLGHT